MFVFFPQFDLMGTEMPASLADLDLVMLACEVLAATNHSAQLPKPDQLQRAAQQLLAYVDQWEGRKQPKPVAFACYLVARLYCRSYRFEESEKFAKKCSSLLNKHAQIAIPGHDDVMEHSRPATIRAWLGTEEWKVSSIAHCVFPPCAFYAGTNFSKQILQNDVAHRGCASLSCGDGCRVFYHLDCWKVGNIFSI